MTKLLFILLVSFTVTLIAAIPFINLLYKLKFQRQREAQKDIFGYFTSIVNRLHGWKVGTPNAGGILIIVTTIILSAVFYKSVPGYEIRTKAWGINWSAVILYLTLVCFGLIGLYDDIRKFYSFKLAGVWGLRIRYKIFLQMVLALFIGYLLYSKIGLSSINVPILDFDIQLGAWYILWSAVVIFATTNAVNITDGLDGLVTGLMLFSLTTFWYLASQINVLDVALFISVIPVSLLAFLYFNIYPARVWLGDTGALSLGAIRAGVGLVINSSLI